MTFSHKNDGGVLEKAEMSLARPLPRGRAYHRPAAAAHAKQQFPRYASYHLQHMTSFKQSSVPGMQAGFDAQDAVRAMCRGDEYGIDVTSSSRPWKGVTCALKLQIS